jgi:hypothetical protein
MYIRTFEFGASCSPLSKGGCDGRHSSDAEPRSPYNGHHHVFGGFIAGDRRCAPITGHRRDFRRLARNPARKIASANSFIHSSATLSRSSSSSAAYRDSINGCSVAARLVKKSMTVIIKKSEKPPARNGTSTPKRIISRRNPYSTVAPMIHNSVID